jgi:hypothetical protein
MNKKEQIIEAVSECLINPLGYRGEDMPGPELMFDFNKFDKKLKEMGIC